jgi:hypothetical protein
MVRYSAKSIGAGSPRGASDSPGSAHLWTVMLPVHDLHRCRV